MDSIFSLRSENRTNLGGMMGTEYTYDNYIKYFSTLEKASEYANKEYNKRRKKKHILGWHEIKKDTEYVGEDLGYVCYFIKKVEIES